MSAKRKSTSKLDHTNWDEDEECDEPGEFSIASEEELKKRVIKKAKRALPASKSQEGKSAFVGLSFKTTTAPKSNTSPFSFLSNFKQDKQEERGVESECTSVPEKLPQKKEEDKMAPLDDKNIFFEKLRALNILCAEWIVKHLNENQHYVLTPIFVDYVKHYRKLEEERTGEKITNTAEIEFMNLVGQDKPSMDPPKRDDSTSNDKPVEKSESRFAFKSETRDEKSATLRLAEPSNFKLGLTSGPPPKSSIPTFGSSNSVISTETSGTSKNGPVKKFEWPKTTASTSMFDASKTGSASLFGSTTFGSAMTPTFGSTSTFGSTLFQFKESEDKRGEISFGSIPPTTAMVEVAKTAQGSGFFSNSIAIAAKNQTTDKGESDKGEGDEDEPPKVTVQVTESDAVYSKRVKVFIKKTEVGYNDHGMGMLSVKLPDENKCQIVVRAVGSIGTILVNCLLTKDVPVKVINNNVVMVCQPTPEAEGITTILMKVKTNEEAVALEETLLKYQR